MGLPEHTSEPLRFDDFERGYNYDRQYTYNRPFYRIVKTLIQDRNQPATVLDIGCGTGIGRNKDMQRELRKAASVYWGVEPDTEVEIEDGLFDRVERCLLEDADLPPNSVDVAYAFMVMEHVQDPEGFLRKVQTLLKPGGVFVFASPNARHFFGIVTYWSHKLHIDQLLLGLVQSKETMEHHYPLAYKINTAALIREHAAAAGLEARVGYCESPTGLRSYLKGPLKLIRWCLIAKRRVLKKPGVLCHIYGHFKKPETPAPA